MTDTALTPTPTTTDEGGEHDLFAHITEKHRLTESIVTGSPVVALCGKVWVPHRDPSRYRLCPTCKEVAESLGWRIPG